jgi:uncharacterized protein (TIGR03437 family)
LVSSLFIASAALTAQPPIAVQEVVDAFRADTRIAPGSRALVRLTAHVASQSVSVDVDGRRATILGIAQTTIHVVIPLDLREGSVELVVTSQGRKTAPFPLTIVSHAPALASASVWPGNYCPVTAPWGTSMVAYGLGPANPVVPPGDAVPKALFASTVLKPTLTIAGRQAELITSALVPGRVNDGSYRIEFRLPPGTPEGTHPAVLSIAGEVSNTEMLRVPGIIPRSSLTGNGATAAPESLFSVYACASPLAAGEAFGDPSNPLTTLLGTTIRLVDSTGVERLAPLLYAAPHQMNLAIPAGTATGPATLIVRSGGGVVSRGIVQVQPIAPELMQTGNWPVGRIMRIRDGATSFEPLVETRNGTTEATAIDLGQPTDEVYLVLLGTGIRGRSSLAGVRAIIDGIDIPVDYAGPQGEVVGLDQVVIRLPRSLATGTRTVVDFSLVVDGKPFVNADGDSIYLRIKASLPPA